MRRLEAQFVRAWIVVAVLVATCGIARPAAAGAYNISLVSASGSRSVTSFGSTTTDSLDEYNNSLNVTSLMGSLTYDYTETYAFQWAMDDDVTYQQDPPVPTTLDLTGTLEVQFRGTSSLMSYDANAWAEGVISASVYPDNPSNGNVVNPKYRTHIETPGDPSTYQLLEDGSGTYNLSKSITLTGDSGTFTVTYSVDLDTGSGVFADLNLQRAIPQGNGKYINITSPQNNQSWTIPIGQNAKTVTFEGWVKVPRGYQGKQFKVYILAWYAENQLQGSVTGTPASGTFTGATGQKASWSITGDLSRNSRNIIVIAELRVWDPTANDFVVPNPQNGDWRHRISLFVN